MVLRMTRMLTNDRRGNVTTLFALSLPILIFSVGAALDFSRAAQLRTKMDSAAHSAAIAALTPNVLRQGDEAAQNAAVSMFNAQIAGVSGLAPGSTSTQVKVTNQNGNPLIKSVTLCYASSAQTPVVGIVGAPTQQIGNCSTATGEVPTGVAATPGASGPITAPWPTAAGYEVPSGCAVPVASASHHTYYVDAVNGSAKGDGSAAHPWQSLSALLANGSFATAPSLDRKTDTWVQVLNPKAPIQPGDVVRLMSGNYGYVLRRGSDGVHTTLIGYDNPDFITIEAAPGATPVITNLVVVGAGKWIFHGLTIQDTLSQLDVRSSGALFVAEKPHHDIILDGNTIMSQADVGGWTESDWISKAATGIFDYGQGYNGAQCISITKNKLVNLGTGIVTQRSDRVLIKDNSINYFIHDGIDYASNDLVIKNNIETNHIDAGDITHVHPDFMQGQPYCPNASGNNCDTISNVLIDSNIAIRQTDPNLPFAAESRAAGIYGTIQGIDTFDGVWKNLTITNNVIITTAYQGISYYGVHGIVIANNILINDGNSKTISPWITVQDQKNKTISEDVVIRNNITPGLTFEANVKNITVDHNLCVSNGKCHLEMTTNGTPKDQYNPGTYSDGNVIYPYTAATLFKNLTIFNGVVTGFNLDLQPRTPAVGTGNAADAPTTYINGKPRSGSMDLGAYPTSS